MAEQHGNFIQGEWRPSHDGKTFADENPAERGSVLGHFAASGASDIGDAVTAAHLAEAAWAQTPLEKRQDIVSRFLQRLRDSEPELASIVSRENGKTIREARAEVQSALAEGDYHARQVSAFLGETVPMAADGVSGHVRYEPVGVAAIISPWNFPVNVMCRKTLPALLTGNTVVFKPASFTPWSGVFMARLFEAAGVPPGVFNCVTGQGGRIGDALVDDPRVRAISFTGSTPVGTAINARAAKRLVRTQLELGGKNAAIVMADADMDLALNAVMAAAFACAGQWCTSTSRLLLHRPIHDAFLARLAVRCEAVVVGDPLDETTDMGAVAGAQQFESIVAAIERGRQEGARLVTGGKAVGPALERGYFIRPTVFADVTPAMTLFREEIFGPVLAVTVFDDLDAALALANDSVYGLTSSLFTGNLAYAQRYVREIRAGMAHVNMHTGYKHPSLPFGGWKQSGAGLPENGRTGLEFFVERKAVYVAERRP